MKLSKRHVILLSLIFLLKCLSKSFFINLKIAGQIRFKEDKEVLASIPHGHYTFQSLADELSKGLESYKNKKKKRTRNKQTQFCAKNNSLGTNHWQRNLG